MRMHIELDDELLAEVDRLAGPRGSAGRLATGNPKHFPIPGLILDRWPVGA